MVFGNRGARRGMIAGAAIASSRAKKRAAMAQPQAAPATASSAQQTNDIEQLKQLADLRDKGILTEEEFAAKKKQILGL